MWARLFKCFPGRAKKSKSKNGDGLEDASALSDGFTAKIKAKAVAIVLSGYDTEIAAASIGPPCDADIVQRWVNLYRPPFFEDGMRCPPALITWWMNELARRDEEFSDALEEQHLVQLLPVSDPNSTASITAPVQVDNPAPPPVELASTSADCAAAAAIKILIQDLNENGDEQTATTSG